MKDIEIIVILLIIFYFLMRNSKKEQFGHIIWNCKGNKEEKKKCMMFHQNVNCSESETNAGNCPQEKIHDEYKKNQTNPNYQHTKETISKSIMFRNKQATSNQQTDKTTSQNAQVNQQTDNTSSQETINLKQHENTTLSELCTKLGM